MEALVERAFDTMINIFIRNNKDDDWGLAYRYEIIDEKINANFFSSLVTLQKFGYQITFNWEYFDDMLTTLC